MHLASKRACLDRCIIVVLSKLRDPIFGMAPQQPGVSTNHHCAALLRGQSVGRRPKIHAHPVGGLKSCAHYLILTT